jgi:hypothetical protein
MGEPDIAFLRAQRRQDLPAEGGGTVPIKECLAPIERDLVENDHLHTFYPYRLPAGIGQTFCRNAGLSERIERPNLGLGGLGVPPKEPLNMVVSGKNRHNQ